MNTYMIVVMVISVFVGRSPAIAISEPQYTLEQCLAIEQVLEANPPSDQYTVKAYCLNADKVTRA